MSSSNSPMTIEISEQDGVTIFSLNGRLDVTTAPKVDDVFANAFAEGDRKFVWDVAGLTHVSSAGLRSVLAAMKKLETTQGKLVISSPSSMIMEIFDISGFKFLLAIYPDRNSAVSAALKGTQ